VALERIERAADTNSLLAGGWWTRYRTQASHAGLTSTSLRVVELDAEYILHRGILGAGIPGVASNSWPESRLRKGLVVGSVQSGKTASMLAVAAKCLDAKVDVVVLLTGTRVSLWRQTLERIVEQLDGWSPSTEAIRMRERVMIPEPRIATERSVAVPITDLYQVTGARVRRMLGQQRPIVAVAMKNSDHLMRLASNLRTALLSALPRLDRPVHMVVIDDEADDGSILDAVVESGYGPDSEVLKQLPRHITGLWSEHSGQRFTFDPNVFATYVAYTATPQANLLQSDHNPLSPEDFVVALRTPGEAGSIEAPRATTYFEPEGARKYYTGGEVFYRTPRNSVSPLCVVLDEPAREDYDTDSDFEEASVEAYLGQVSDGLRAFFVAAAMRLYHDGRRISSLRGVAQTSEESVAQACPPPTCMLVNPAASINVQFDAARLIAAWSADPRLATVAPSAFPKDDDGKAVLVAEGLSERLELEEEQWRAWFDSYERTRGLLVKASPTLDFSANEASAWQDVKTLLRDEVFPHARLAVVNSNPMADDRPAFAPSRGADGHYRPPQDLISIFVSGNVMARGITLEGLTTTLFLRDSREPAADTQMQMQRWFGYRGAYLYWCRVFLYADQLNLFISYHDNDEALKGVVMAAANQSVSEAPRPIVLQGARFKATGKIANLRALPLCPGRQPFVGVLAQAQYSDENSGTLAALLGQGQWPDLVANGLKRGIIREQPADFSEVAAFLEALRYEVHDPDPDGMNHKRWRAIERGLELGAAEAPLFRPPGVLLKPIEAVSPPSCPYSIAAYLRLWQALLSRNAKGFFPTDDDRTRWSMISLAKYAATAPNFYIGVRFGGSDAGMSKHPQLASFGIQRVVRDHDGPLLKATWGSRNPGESADAYMGDHLFDYYYHRRSIPSDQATAGWRPRGEPGLLLIHVVKTAVSESVVPALVLPLGGPDHFAAHAPRNRRTLVVQ
jgi:hypothetical protein